MVSVTTTRELTITEDHLRLLPHLWFRWEDEPYSGAPAVDIKRPYGNSDVLGDLIEHLRPELFEAYTCGESDEDGVYRRAVALLDVHRQMADVLNILVTSFLFDSRDDLRRTPQPRFELDVHDLIGTWTREFPHNRWVKERA